ncbi:hypothetical protein ABHI18_010280 [Aspergillus niger]
MSTSHSPSPQTRQEPTTHFYPSPSPSPSPPESNNQHHGNIENHLDRYERTTSLSGTINITVESPSSSSHDEVNSKSTWSRSYHD